jgi:hypothetical protein
LLNINTPHITNRGKKWYKINVRRVYLPNEVVLLIVNCSSFVEETYSSPVNMD